MTVTLRQITAENWRACTRLQVADEQRHFVANNAYSLAQSKYQTYWETMGIYHQENIVGFVMFGLDPDDNIYWVCRLMVDKNHQKQGFGTIGLQLVIAMLRERPDCKEIAISFEPENTVAAKLYQRLGFVESGEIIEGEVVARLKF